MGTALITLKIMPESTETNLNIIQEQAKKIIEEKKGTNIKFEEQAIAFGLKAIIIFFHLNEEFELEPIETSLSRIEKVSSVQVTDMRRAIE
jgi:translation elongation factor aEF-1 beta